MQSVRRVSVGIAARYSTRATKGFAPPGGNFVDYVLLNVYYLTGFLKHVSLLVGAFGCYSVLITLSSIF